MLWLKCVCWDENKWETIVISNIEKKTVDFCENGPFKAVSRFYFRCLDENKDNLTVCNKNESTYICRYDGLPYYHR